MAQDYAKADPERTFAERRGISFGERVAGIVKAVPEKARGMFDGLRLAIGRTERGAAAPERERSIFADFRPVPRPHEPERSNQFARDQQSMRSEEHTSELQSLMRISYAVFCLKKKNKIK